MKMLQGQNQPCKGPLCFFCIMSESDQSQRRAKLLQCFQVMPLRDDDQAQVLVLSGLWNIAMAQPDDPEFPSLGIFQCMGKLIHKGIADKEWLLRDQNIYIPYYAAHIVGSYTMNKAEFARTAVDSGVVSPLVELLRGRLSWLEQRVAVRALGHLASYEMTFEAVAAHELEIIELAMEIACSCFGTVYQSFLGLRESRRAKYQRDLLTRGLGEVELENRKAQEWAYQLQSWSLSLLDCFASRGRCLDIMCKKQFLKGLCGMRGGLADSSAGGLGLITTLCKSKTGRERVADVEEAVQGLCNISRSSDVWQYLAIGSLLLLLTDMDTRYKVLDKAALSLGDLVELRSLRERKRVGDRITQALLLDYHIIKYDDSKLENENTKKALDEIWHLKVERRNREKLMSEQEIGKRKHLVGMLKQEGNKEFSSGHLQEATIFYTKAIEFCPLMMRKERLVLYSNRAQCYLLLGDHEAAISDTTRALCVSSASRPHGKSLWRRAQAHDLKGLGRESLMDSLMFIECSMRSDHFNHPKIPSYAARMIEKQVNATWPFGDPGKRQKDARIQKINVI